MIKIMYSFLIILLLSAGLTGCAVDPGASVPDSIEASDNDQVPDSPAILPEAGEEHMSNSEISQMFIDALYETGFDFEMDLQKYEKAAKTIMLPNGKSLFENGYLYKFENLKGEEYSYGQKGALISLNTSATNTSATDDEIFDTYQLYVDSALGGISGISLPGGLSFGSTFEESLKYFDIYHTYQKQKSDDFTVELYNENDESLYIFFAGLHGAIMDNSLENAHANLTYKMVQNENAVFCSLYYAGGKLFACQYTARIKNDSLIEAVSNDKIKANFYQLPINMDNITGTIDSIVFTPDSIELTVTIKSATGEIEAFDYYIDIMLSADVVAMLGPFSFEAGKNENTQTSIYKDSYSSWQNDYFNLYLDLSGLGPFSLSNGSIYYNTSMSR